MQNQITSSLKCVKTQIYFLVLIIYDCLWLLASKTTSFVINRAQGFTTIPLRSCSHAIAELAADLVNRVRDPPASYSIGTLGGLFFLFSGVMNAWHRQSKLLYLTLQALYSPVLNRLNMQGSVLHSLKINKPNSKLSMALPPSLPFSIHLCQPDTILHFASWFSWVCEWAFCVSKTLLSCRLIPKEFFCIKRH